MWRRNGQALNGQIPIGQPEKATRKLNNTDWLYIAYILSLSSSVELLNAFEKFATRRQPHSLATFNNFTRSQKLDIWKVVSCSLCVCIAFKFILLRAFFSRNSFAYTFIFYVYTIQHLKYTFIKKISVYLLNTLSVCVCV